jgi:hypothetical protein
MYRVIKYFTDLHDNEYEYHVGDIFPRKGIKVTKERLTELSTKENLQGEALIELVEEQDEGKSQKTADMSIK